MTMPGRLGEGWVESLTWRRNSVSSVMYMLLYSGSYFDNLRPIRDALHDHVLQASCQDDSFGVITAMHVVCFTTGEIVLKITLILQLKSLLRFIGWCIILK